MVSLTVGLKRYVHDQLEANASQFQQFFCTEESAHKEQNMMLNWCVLKNIVSKINKQKFMYLKGETDKSTIIIMWYVLYRILTYFMRDDEEAEKIKDSINNASNK